jgi:hypothetical protein
VRFTQVLPRQDQFTIRNFGPSTVDVSNYRLSANGVNLDAGLNTLTLVAGSYILASGDSITLADFSLDDR